MPIWTVPTLPNKKCQIVVLYRLDKLTHDSHSEEGITIRVVLSSSAFTSSAMRGLLIVKTDQFLELGYSLRKFAKENVAESNIRRWTQ